MLTVLAEYGLTDMPVLAGLDFGHIQPMLTLAHGAEAEIDCASARLNILESGTV